MRYWVDVYDKNDIKLGTAFEVQSAQVTEVLDEAGTITLTYSPAAQKTVELMKEENRVRIWVEQNGKRMLFGSGVIRDLLVNDAESSVVTANGPDSLDALTRKSVLLGRIYDGETIINIVSDLVSLVTGWTSTVTDTGSQTARFDGVSVLKALLRVAQEKGLHLRLGETPNSVELGAFGDDNGITAVAPYSATAEMQGRDDVVLIERISRKVNSREVINWIIPQGAGQGTAALTLEDSTHTLNTITLPDGREMPYLSDPDSIETYGQSEKIVAFSNIAPIENTDAAKIAAADALYDAAMAWLERNSQPLITYSISLKKVNTPLRVGDKIRVIYKGIVETETGQFTYLDVNGLFWVNKISKKAVDSGISWALDIASIDRAENDEATIVTSAIESAEARNVNVEPKAIAFSYQDTDILGSNAPVSFRFRVNDIFTTVSRIKMNIHAVPMKSESYWTSVPANMLFWQVTPGYNYPSDVSISIDGVDVTAALGGPWNPGGGNAEIDVDVDITNYIKNASGGLYQDHSIVFTCLSRVGQVRLDSGYSSLSNAQASTGKITATYTVSGSSQAII